MKNDLIVTKVLELELRQGRQKSPSVILLRDDAERQDEYGVLWIDSVQSVVAAFIHKDEIISAVHRTIVCRQQS